ASPGCFQFCIIPRMENPEFLRRKYSLHTSPEVKRAAARTQSRKETELPQGSDADNDALIQNYLDRISNIINPPKVKTLDEDFDRGQRNLAMLKSKLHDLFVIKYEEIPEAYFGAIKERHKEEGRPIDEVPEEIRRSLAETIIRGQERSLDRWVNY